MTRILEFSKGANRVQAKRTLELQGFVAEFFTNEKVAPPIHHYVIMRKGSVEILGWGQERTLESAERMARDCMETMSQRETLVV